MLVAADWETRGAELRQDAVSLSAREEVDLHGLGGELRGKFLPARTGVRGIRVDVSLNGANGNVDVQKIAVRIFATRRIADGNDDGARRSR